MGKAMFALMGGEGAELVRALQENPEGAGWLALMVIVVAVCGAVRRRDRPPAP